MMKYEIEDKIHKLYYIMYYYTESMHNILKNDEKWKFMQENANPIELLNTIKMNTRQDMTKNDMLKEPRNLKDTLMGKNGFKRSDTTEYKKTKL